MTSLPPLASLRVFDSVARKLNFTRAGEELGMTQAAVSYQVKLLEEWTGVKLFVRRGRGIALTEAAQRLAPQTVEAFTLLRRTYNRDSRSEHQVLSISTTFVLATKWLAPRLGSFSLSHPDIAVRLDATERVVDFGQEDIDVVIRAGKGQWPGLTSSKLLDIDFAPMLSPDLAASVGGIHEPRDLLKLPLLDPTHKWWPRWLAAYDLPLQVLESQPPAALHLQALDGDAALAGAGVALLAPLIYQDELASGRLVQPFSAMREQTWSYWLAYPDSRRNLYRIKAFTAWLDSQLATSV